MFQWVAQFSPILFLALKKTFLILACLVEQNQCIFPFFRILHLCMQHFIIILQGVWNIRLAKMCICSETCTTLFEANQRCVTPFIIVCTKSLIFKKMVLYQNFERVALFLYNCFNDKQVPIIGEINFTNSFFPLICKYLPFILAHSFSNQTTLQL